MERGRKRAAAAPLGAARPPGILWQHFDDEKIAAVPVLSIRHQHR